MCVAYVCVPLCPQGVRKDRGRVLRRDKRRAGTGDKPAKELEHRKVPLQERRKHGGSGSSGAGGGGGGGGGKSSVTDMPPDQVLIPVETKNIDVREILQLVCAGKGRQIKCEESGSFLAVALLVPLNLLFDVSLVSNTDLCLPAMSPGASPAPGCRAPDIMFPSEAVPSLHGGHHDDPAHQHGRQGAGPHDRLGQEASRLE